MRLHLLITADSDSQFAGIVGLREGRFGGVQARDLTTCSSTSLPAKARLGLANPCGPIKGGTP